MSFAKIMSSGKKEKAVEKQYMDIIQQEFGDRILEILPLLDEDIKGGVLDIVADRFVDIKDIMLEGKIK